MTSITQKTKNDTGQGIAVFLASAIFLIILLGLTIIFLILPRYDKAFDFRETATEIAIDATVFPDVRFRSYVASNFDTDTNGMLSIKERLAVTSMGSYDTTSYSVNDAGLSNMQITSLIGIALFPNLEYIEAGGNSITNVDITGNEKLRCLDMRNNTEFGLTYSDINQGTQILVSNDYQLHGDVNGIDAIIA